MSGLEARVHTLMMGSVYLLLVPVLWLLWHALPGADPARAMLALLLTLPLAAPLPGLWQRRRRTAVWTVLLLAPYLAVGLMEVIAHPAARAAATAVIAAVFTTAVLLIAWLRVSRRQPPSTSSDSA